MNTNGIQSRVKKLEDHIGTPADRITKIVRVICKPGERHEDGTLGEPIKVGEISHILKPMVRTKG